MTKKKAYFLRKRLLGFLMIIALAVGLAGFILMRNKSREMFFENDGKVNVVVSFYPLEEFTKQIGKEKVRVVSLTPAGVEPHDFEPTPQDLVKVQRANLFVYNGAGFEPWVDRILPDLGDSGIVVINSSEQIELLDDKEQHEEDSEESHFDELFDPHIWLDPLLAIKQVDAIKEGLIKIDPENKLFYEKNADDYKKVLSQLDEDFARGLKVCNSKNVVVSHGSIGYLAKRYGLEVTSLLGINPDKEPSPSEMAAVVDFARKNKINHIFFETLISPRLSETIANEIGAKTLVFNPIEGLSKEEEDQGESYLSIQRDNLANIRMALGCK